MEYEKILEIAESGNVELALSFKEEINKKLALGMTRYVCRYGTLSDGHEKLTDAQKYFQAIKEMWSLGTSMSFQKVSAMKAQADLLDAEDSLKESKKESDILRAKARILEAKNALTVSLVNIQDLERQLDEFNKVRLELAPVVEAMYPEGIEQAEEDSWKAVFEYRAMKGDHKVQNIPLRTEIKAELGLNTGNIEAIAPLAFSNKESFVTKMNQLSKIHNAMLEQK